MEVVAHVGVATVGLSFANLPPLPPTPLTVAAVGPGTWAEAVGVQVGQELLELNGQPVGRMTEAEFKLAMSQERPLRLTLAKPNTRDSKRIENMQRIVLSLMRKERALQAQVQEARSELFTSKAEAIAAICRQEDSDDEEQADDEDAEVAHNSNPRAGRQSVQCTAADMEEHSAALGDAMLHAARELAEERAVSMQAQEQAHAAEEARDALAAEWQATLRERSAELSDAMLHATRELDEERAHTLRAQQQADERLEATLENLEASRSLSAELDLSIQGGREALPHLGDTESIVEELAEHLAALESSFSERESWLVAECQAGEENPQGPPPDLGNLAEDLAEAKASLSAAQGGEQEAWAEAAVARKELVESAADRHRLEEQLASLTQAELRSGKCQEELRLLQQQHTELVGGKAAVERQMLQVEQESRLQQEHLSESFQKQEVHLAESREAAKSAAEDQRQLLSAAVADRDQAMGTSDGLEKTLRTLKVQSRHRLVQDALGATMELAFDLWRMAMQLQRSGIEASMKKAEHEDVQMQQQLIGSTREEHSQKQYSKLEEKLEEAKAFMTPSLDSLMEQVEKDYQAWLAAVLQQAEPEEESPPSMVDDKAWAPPQADMRTVHEATSPPSTPIGGGR